MPLCVCVWICVLICVGMWVWMYMCMYCVGSVAAHTCMCLFICIGCMHVDVCKHVCSCSCVHLNSSGTVCM